MKVMKYVIVCAVIAIHIVTICVHIHRRLLKGKPLTCNKIMLNDAKKAMVLKIMYWLYAGGRVYAIMDCPASCGFCALVPLGIPS